MKTDHGDVHRFLRTVYPDDYEPEPPYPWSPTDLVSVSPFNQASAAWQEMKRRLNRVTATEMPFGQAFRYLSTLRHLCWERVPPGKARRGFRLWYPEPERAEFEPGIPILPREFWRAVRQDWAEMQPRVLEFLQELYPSEWEEAIRKESREQQTRAAEYARLAAEERAAIQEETPDGDISFSPSNERAGADDPARRAGGDGDGSQAPEIFSESLADWMERPAPPVQYLFEGLRAKNAIGMTFGRPKSMKTTLLFQQGLCLAAGVEFIGFGVPRVGRVLYVDEETGRELLEERYRRQMKANPLFEERGTRERFRVVTMRGIKIDTAKGFDQLEREIGRAEPDWVVLDTFRRVYTATENDSDKIAAVFDKLYMLRALYSTGFEVVHHTKKNPDEGDWLDAARGSGDLIGACEGISGMWRRAGSASYRAISKGAREVEPFALALDEETLTFTRSTAPAALKVNPEEAAIKILKDQAGRSMASQPLREALKRAGVSEDRAKKFLAGLPPYEEEKAPEGVKVARKPDGIPGSNKQYLVYLSADDE